MGSIYKRGEIFWIKFYRDGHPMRESSRSTKESVAKHLLRLREGDVARGVPVTPKMGRVRMSELFDAVASDYEINGRRTVDHVKRRVKLHLGPFFGRLRAGSVSADHIRRFVTERQAKVSNAEINRELAVLKRAFRLGMQDGKVMARPPIPKLDEGAPRQGFFEREQFERVRVHLPEPLRALVTFLYATGWRALSEVLPLQWRQVDLGAGAVRLDRGSTKNGDGRVFPFTAELRELLEAQRSYTRGIERERGVIIPWVFHRDGERIKSFYSAWHTACRKAGCPGRIPHDFRRTAVRNLVRAGVPDSVAMQMTGHRTRSIFSRYDIVSEGDLRDAARRLDLAAGTISGTIARETGAEGASEKAK